MYWNLLRKKTMIRITLKMMIVSRQIMTQIVKMNSSGRALSVDNVLKKGEDISIVVYGR